MFILHRYLNLDVAFRDKTIKTHVYIKMDAHVSYYFQKECVDNLGSFHTIQMSKLGVVHSTRRMMKSNQPLFLR